MKQNMSWIKKGLAFGLVFFIFILSIKSMDSVIGFFDQNKQSSKERFIVLREHPPKRDSWVTPDDAYMQSTDSLTQKAVRMRVDDNGFITGPTPPANGKNETIDIIFLGGSTTEAIYVSEELRFPHYVSLLLRNKNGSAITTLNGGVSGNHSLHSLLSFLGKGVPLKPRFAIVMHAANDLSLLSKTLSYWNAPNTRAIIQSNPPRGLLKKIKDFLIPNIWGKIRPILYSHINSNNLQIDEWQNYRNTDGNSRIQIQKALKSEFSASLNSFIDIARNWKIEPILMTQFNRIKHDDIFVKAQYEQIAHDIPFNEFVELYELTNEIIRDIAKKKNVLLIDLDKEIESSSSYMYDAVHLNEKGSILVAQIIAEQLHQNKPEDFTLATPSSQSFKQDYLNEKN